MTDARRRPHRRCRPVRHRRRVPPAGECPGKTYAILESRDAIGGTWDLFRYPGIRSDSDMYTLSYPFRPWTHGKSIADGEDIRRYIEETAHEDGIDQHIRYGHRVASRVVVVGGGALDGRRRPRDGEPGRR